MLKINIRKKLHGVQSEMTLDVNLLIEEGSFVALSGKSGSGKTTLLRLLAGLEKAEGNIEIDSEVWLDGKQSVTPQKRGIGFVFQDYALFPNMSVEENLLFVKKDNKLANRLLEITELGALRKRLPSRLSGGQQQRVALCRAMMNRPKLLLLDEPLSALDSSMRIKLQNEILALHEEFGTTTIMVSHDASEIYRLSSRVIELDNGKVVNDGTPKEVMMQDKNTLKGELLEISKNGILTVLVGQQLLEMVFSKEEAISLKVGDFIDLTMHKTL